MYMCIYIHMYIHICTYLSIHICIRMHTYTNVYVNTYMYIHKYTHTHIYVCKPYMQPYIYTYIYIHVHTYIYIHTRLHTPTFARILIREFNMYVCVYTYTHMSYALPKYIVSITGIRTSDTTGRRGPIGCLIFRGHFPQKSPVISGSFAKRDFQLKAFYAFSPSCKHLLIRVKMYDAYIHTCMLYA